MAVAPEEAVTYADVEDAARALAGRVRETPLLSSGELSRRLGTRVVLKAENLQLTGSFKARGATNAISRLSDASWRRASWPPAPETTRRRWPSPRVRPALTALLVMPERASLAKVAAVRQYGGEVTFVDGGYDEAQAEAARLTRERGMREIHAFDAPDVVAGQGTVGLELARQAPDTRLVVVPLGGGGLAGGIALAVAAVLPKACAWLGVQAEACAPYIDSLAAHARWARAPPTRSATASPSSARATSRCRWCSATWTRS